MKSRFSKFGFIALAALMYVVPLAAQKKTGTLDAPVVEHAGSSGSSIRLTVTAGPTGAPAGFSVQWMRASDLPWPTGSGYVPASFCKASFSGNAQGRSFDLAPGGSVTFWIGDVLFDTPGASSSCESIPLDCGEEYVFRAFAHANAKWFRSAWSSDLTASTSACSYLGCTYTQGFWKTHGPSPTGNNVNEWPVTGLMLGAVDYTDAELQAILDTPAAGNGLIALAHQLIAARLNEANGADVGSVATVMTQADNLIGNLVVPSVGTGFLKASATSTLTDALAGFNEGLTGPGHCR